MRDDGRRPPDTGIVIIGAGPVGAVAAMYLAPRFGPVTVLEKRPDPRRGSGRAGRSITVMLSVRGWRTLAELGLDDMVRGHCLPIHGRCAHLPDGASRHVTPYSRDRRPIWSVERDRLNELLLDAAEATPGVTVRFDQRVRRVDLDRPAVVLEGAEPLMCRHVLGCDGAHSVARAALVERGVPARVATLDWAHQEISVPGGDWLDPSTMHYWPAGDALFAAFPLRSGRYAGSLFLRRNGPPPSYAALDGAAELHATFRSCFPEPAAVVEDLGEQLAGHAPATITLASCDRWVWRDRLALLGDACHAMAPFMGHGMNCGFEDVRTLVGCLDAAADWTSALAAYQSARMADAEAIAHLSYQHYSLMADPPPADVPDPRGALRARLFDVLPDRFVPLYERCAFTEASYASVLRDDQRLDTVVEDLLRRYGDGLGSAPDDRLRAYVSEIATAGLEESRCT